VLLRFPVVCVLVVALAGCKTQQVRCVPPSLTKYGPLVDLSAPPGEDHALESKVVADLLRGGETDASAQPVGRQYKILALSGGAVFGAYTAGFLNGWTRTGERPEFDIVTGVSVGGLISSYAFLGPAYDRELCELFTTIDSGDVFRRRPTIALLWSDSAASSSPLRRLIDDRVDCELLRQVAQQYARGRRLYIGTTDLDRRRFVVWDMGAIASSNRPDALELYRKVVLASASVPGFFPPVAIDVTVNGECFTERHGDGGTANQVFIPGTVLATNRDAIKAGEKPLVGSDTYVIIAGKLYADPICVEPRVKDIASSALTALTSAQTRGDMIRIWTLCRLTGMRYHSTAIPQDAPAPLDSLSFRPAEMQKMLEIGVCEAMARRWRNTPPGTEAGEQFVPRAGTDFLAPVVDGTCRPLP